MNILVLGYSVTAELGFVEIAQNSKFCEKFSIKKIGLGGFQPSSAIHVFQTELKIKRPDIVILEQSTPAFRIWEKDRLAYKKYVEAILRECFRIGAKFSFLELQRKDVDFEVDWVVSLHKELCDRFCVGQVLGAVNPSLLRDEVHPNEEGRKEYSNSFIDAIRKASCVTATEACFLEVPEYAAVPIKSFLIGVENLVWETYTRGGFIAEMLRIKEGDSVDILLGKDSVFVGFIGMAGPRTGWFDVEFGEISNKIKMYDEYCYYSRASSKLIKNDTFSDPGVLKKLKITQLSEVPLDPLLKGSKDSGPRVGGLSHLLVKIIKNSNYEEGDYKMNKAKFKKNVFSRGFLISETKADLHKIARTSAVSDFLNGWQSTFFGPFQILFDKNLNYSKVSSDRLAVAVMGLCLNPFDGSISNQSVAESLYRALNAGESCFYEKLDELSGNFVVLYRINADVKVLQDCAATKPVYFYRNALFGTVVASHANLIALPLALMRDPRADYILENEEYKKDPSRYLPGDITPYAGLKALTANNFLRLRDASTHRFFPRESLELKELSDDIVAEVSGVFIEQARLLRSIGRPIQIATTAGKDSRVSVASFSKFDDVKLFSFYFSHLRHLDDDVYIARAMSDILGLHLDVFDLAKYVDSDFRGAFNLTSPKGIWPGAALCYISEFDQDLIHVRSTVSEIGRCFYGRRSGKEVTPDYLASIFTTTEFGKDEVVVSAMEKFIAQANFDKRHFYNYDLHDMFYWEHRNSKWQNILCQEAEMATDVFIPFNNRKLIMMFLSLDPVLRKSAELHKRIVAYVCPSLRDVPYVS